MNYEGGKDQIETLLLTENSFQKAKPYGVNILSSFKYNPGGGGGNKRGGWQISAKIINREGATNGKAGKNLQS